MAVTNGKLDFGPWEQIFYGEFDGAGQNGCWSRSSGSSGPIRRFVSRHEELQRSLDGRLEVDPAQAVRKTAEFRVREDPNADDD